MGSLLVIMYPAIAHLGSACLRREHERSCSSVATPEPDGAVRKETGRFFHFTELGKARLKRGLERISGA